jgi:hypothetical protein
MAKVYAMIGKTINTTATPSAFTIIGQTVRTSWRRLALWGVLFAVLFQFMMLLALVLRFQAVPNYITFYDWIGNVIWIIKSTPSWGDMLPIIAEEWLIEIGRMNYDYGTGISVWSFNLIPSKFATMFCLGTLVGLCSILMKRDACSAGSKRGLTLSTGLGAGLVAMTNVTMSWVVCCATPSWVVGLAMLGLGVSTSLALETMGPLLNGTGLILLCATIYYLAWKKAAQFVDAPKSMKVSYA